MNRFKTAFTLAEVLITLVIVGIVAAMTIPTVINRSNELQYTAGAKKLHSNLVNAIRTIQANGGVTVPEGEDYTDAWIKQFCSVLSCAQVSNDKKNFFADSYKSYDSSPVIEPGECSAQMVLNNGTVIGFNGLFCDNDGICGGIYVDTNGPKGPNTEAMDYYIFTISEENSSLDLAPYGIWDLESERSIDTAIKMCSEYHICSALRIYAPDKLPKT